MKVSKHKEFLQKCLFNYCNTYISVKNAVPASSTSLKRTASISCIFESVAILKFEHGAVDYSRLPIFILIRFWEIKKFFAM
jgi:hypothetical protein